MKKKIALRITSPEVFLLSLFGIGFIPKAPGTFGTLATMPIIIGINMVDFPLFFATPLYISLFVISAFSINYAQKKYSLQDPSWIVIDELLGFIIVAPFVLEAHWLHYLYLFILFRIFDITKVFPIGTIDRKMKNGIGVILDDIVAGIMTVCAYRITFFILTQIKV